MLIQKTARLFENFLAPVQASQTVVEKTYVAFDQIVQLIACDIPAPHSPSNDPLILSTVANEPYINKCQEIDENCEITCAPSSSLIARNSFVIRRPTTERTNDGVEYLKYGQDFMLECYESKEKPLLLYSMPKNPVITCHDNIFKAHGEMKQFVGLALHASHNNNGDVGPTTSRMTIETVPSAFFVWRLFHIDPELRFETIGENVLVGLSFILCAHFRKN